MAWADHETALASAELAEFGVSATHKPEVGGSYAVSVVLSRGAREDGSSVSAIQCMVRLADFTVTPKVRDVLTINGQNYYVLEIHPDLDGISAILILNPK